MKVGDLVSVHWGNCDKSGSEGIDWGYSHGIVVGETRWWKEHLRGKSPCGDIDILLRGDIVSFNIGRLEVVRTIDEVINKEGLVYEKG